MYKDKLIIGNFLSSLFYSFTYPFLHVWVMKDLTETYISINQIISCLAIVLFGTLWNKKSNVLYKFMPLFLILEIVLYTILTGLTYCDLISPALYYLGDIVLCSTVTRNIICGSNKIAMLLHNDETREKFDNNMSIATAVASLIGSGLTLIIKFPIKLILVLILIGISIDNFLYLRAYKESLNKKDKIQN